MDQQTYAQVSYLVENEGCECELLTAPSVPSTFSTTRFSIWILILGR